MARLLLVIWDLVAWCFVLLCCVFGFLWLCVCLWFMVCGWWVCVVDAFRVLFMVGLLMWLSAVVWCGLIDFGGLDLLGFGWWWLVVCLRFCLLRLSWGLAQRIGGWFAVVGCADGVWCVVGLRVCLL